MVKHYFILAIASLIIALILILSGIYAFAGYIFFILVATLVFFTIIIKDILNKTSNWKKYFKFLSFGYVALIIVLTTYQIDIYLNKHRVDKIISDLYVYKLANGNFPKKIEQISSNSETSHCNYIPDSSFKNFKLYHRDSFGFPWTFTSVDSTWKGPGVR
jgi:predicted membrane channel-forming protein YqfA (hemolysin III family)